MMNHTHLVQSLKIYEHHGGQPFYYFHFVQQIEMEVSICNNENFKYSKLRHFQGPQSPKK